jgi:proline iminopeptidase
MFTRISFLFIVTWLLISCASTPLIQTSNGSETIARMEKVLLGGYPQWVLMRSHDINNPVLLILHGGPGASETGMFRKFNHELEKHFTVAYWDQRGAGKSYSKNLDLNTLTLRQLISDTRELTGYLKKRFQKEKIFLLGHSWGSRLGLYAIHERPQDFYAFVGVGQDLASEAGDSISYAFTLKRARELGNKKAIKELEASGPPPYEFMHGVRQKHWLLKVGGERYDRKNYLDWIFAIWFSREYTFGDLFRWSKGSATTAGRMLSDPSFTPFDVRKEIISVEVPVFFISGAWDYNTPWPLVKQYSDSLNAPYKEFILFEKSAHSPPFEQPLKFNSLIIEKLLPLAKGG